MQQLVQALAITPQCTVLEIGFGMGYSATEIQKHRPRSHAIIECDPEVLKRAAEWSTDQQTESEIEFCEGYWQQLLAPDSAWAAGRKFDCVFFDDFPLPVPGDEQHVSASDTSEQGVSRWSQFVQACLPVLQPGARITGYMARAVDIDVPGFDKQLEMVPIAVPEDCPYMPYNEACIPLLTYTGSEDNSSSSSRKKQRRAEQMHASVLSSLGLDPPSL